jgi:hypothetical protein
VILFLLVFLGSAEPYGRCGEKRWCDDAAARRSSRRSELPGRSRWSIHPVVHLLIAPPDVLASLDVIEERREYSFIRFICQS